MHDSEDALPAPEPLAASDLPGPATPHHQAESARQPTARVDPDGSGPGSSQSAGDTGAAQVTDLPGTEEVKAPGIRLELKHPRAIRWMHWINFPILFTMIWSGLLIYWGDSDNAYLHPHRIYRIGIGSVTLFRFFPEWVYTWLNAPYRITTGLGYHFFFMWIFGVNGLIYATYLLATGEWRLLVPTVKSWREAIQVTLYDLHLSEVHPPVKKYNGAQKIAYTTIVLMGAGSLITGLAIYKPTQAHLVTSLLGGYEMARWEHFWLTIGFMAFFLLHVFQVVKTGWNNFRGMVTGYEIRPADQPLYTEERRGE